MKSFKTLQNEINIGLQKKPPQSKIRGVSLYGSEISGLKNKNGRPFTAKPVIINHKLAYRVTDEFGSFETLNLKAFAKKFG